MDTTASLTTISMYGNYSGNYGVHALKVNMGIFELYYSYETIVAFYDPKFGLVVSENIFSNTTGKHINAIEPNKKERLNREEFEHKLNAMLEYRINNHVAVPVDELG